MNRGTVGYPIRRFDIPVGPAVVGCILGRELETRYRRTIQIDLGDEKGFLDRSYPIATSILAVAIILFLAPRIWRQWTTTRSTTPASIDC